MERKRRTVAEARKTAATPGVSARKKEITVPGYIAEQPAEVRRVLKRVRQIVRKALPKAQETISYQIPTYKIDGRSVVYFAGWKEHWSMYPVSDRVRTALGAALDQYEFSKGTIRFPLSEPLPAALVERIVRELGRRATSRRR
jgi:uncharacterized protein YdhG (YjbR/CyaY superfamily)